MLEMERVISGKQTYTHGKVYTFRCPECRNEFTYDAPGEPVCTGPSESRDDHPSSVMRLIRVVSLDKREKHVPAEVAAARAAGPLWVPPTRET